VTVTILQGDALDVLKTLDAESVQCVVTSPPYYGQRDYGLPPTVWGGSDDCWHVWGDDQKPAGYRSNENRNTEGLASEAIQRRDQWQWSNFCQLCGAWRGQLGLEPTPELYVEHLVDVFREVKRVLRDDGVLWLNLGDSFVNKQLVGIPWRVAFALQAAGWWLRSDIIWHKPNPMPESVKDRCTKAHEYVFMLTKSARYYYDHKAIKEPSVSDRPSGSGYKRDERLSYRDEDGPRGNDEPWMPQPTRNRRDVWTIATQPCPLAHFATMPPELAEVCIKAGSAEGDTVLDPFGGAGTTGLVADRLGRDAILIELNGEYCDTAEGRIKADAGMWADMVTRILKETR
jgi:DNA modification methylase